jgi:hypothetical protein
MTYTEDKIRPILAGMIDTREICGTYEGEEYTIALMELVDDGLLCWQGDVGDFLVPIWDFTGCSSQQCLEDVIWRAFIAGLDQEIDATGQLMECTRCGHEWISRVARPKKCPICQRILCGGK